MTQRKAAWTDDRVEQLMGRLLQAGVIAAATVVLIGGGLYLAHHGNEYADLRTFRGEPVGLRSPMGILRQAFALQESGLIQLGLLVLIATPVARVAFSIFAFARRRDAIYVVITALVLAILLYSLCSGQL